MLENPIARGRVFSEDSADVPYLTAQIINGETLTNTIIGASIDECDDEEEDVSSEGDHGSYADFCRPRLGMVVFPSFIFFMSIFILIPASVQLQLAMVCAVTQGGVYCDSAKVSSMTGRMTLITQLAQSIPAFLLMGFYSSVANRYGRRLVLIISLCGPALYASVLLLLLFASEAGMVMTYSDITAYTTAGSLLLGLSGSFSAFQMAAFSYAADITNKNMAKRGLVYTLLEASLFFGKVIGPSSSGFYAQYFGFKVPLMFIISSCCVAVAWCGMVIREERVFPELDSPLIYNPLYTFRNIGLLWGKTLEQERKIEERRLLYHQFLEEEASYEEEKEEKRSKESQSDREEAVVDGSFGKQSTTLCCCSGSPMPFVAAACFFYFCAFSGNSNVWYLFITHSKGWGPSLIGAYDAYEGFFQFLSMTLVPWLIMKVFKVYVDIYWLLVAYIARAAHYVLLGTAASTGTIFAIAPLLLFGAILAPRSRSIVSQCVSIEEQVDVLSGFCAVQGSAQFFAPLMVYGYTVSVYTAPYATYLAFAGLCALGALCILVVLYTPSIRGRLPTTALGKPPGLSKDPHANMTSNPVMRNEDIDLERVGTVTPLLSQEQLLNN